jgi:hypothetical protein
MPKITQEKQSKNSLLINKYIRDKSAIKIKVKNQINM